MSRRLSCGHVHGCVDRDCGGPPDFSVTIAPWADLNIPLHVRYLERLSEYPGVQLDLHGDPDDAMHLLAQVDCCAAHLAVNVTRWARFVSGGFDLVGDVYDPSTVRERDFIAAGYAQRGGLWRKT